MNRDRIKLMLSVCGLKLDRNKQNYTQLSPLVNSKSKVTKYIMYLNHARNGLRQQPSNNSENAIYFNPTSNVSKSFMYDTQMPTGLPIPAFKPKRYNKEITQLTYALNKKKLSIQGLPLIQDKHKSIYIVKDIEIHKRKSKAVNKAEECSDHKATRCRIPSQIKLSPKHHVKFAHLVCKMNANNKSRNKVGCTSLIRKQVRVGLPIPDIFMTHQLKEIKMSKMSTFSTNSMRNYSISKIDGVIDESSLYSTLNVSKEETIQLVPKINIDYTSLLHFEGHGSIYLYKCTLQL